MDDKDLFNQAVKARDNAYAPYSKFRVGAALLAESGKVYLGCNIENAAFTPTNCAERTAFFKAVSEGERKFKKIAIAAGKEVLVYTSPCGVCRQVMMEFCDPDTFQIIMGTNENDIEGIQLKKLLPKGFGPGLF
ncbi:MAG: cytidine deaminase [Lachnospiraceae bacterium]